MVRTTTAYLADDDSMHSCECAAATKNVDLLVRKAPVEMHEATRRQLTGWLTSEDERICDVLLAYRRACPKVLAEEAPQESGEGPVVNSEHAAYCANHNGFDCDCGQAAKDQA